MSTALQLFVDPRSPVPVFHQLREQVTALVASGALPSEARLPSVRQLAADLGLAAGTVARAYRELEADGVVTSRRRTGTTVATTAAPVDAVAEAARGLVVAGRARGLGDEEVLDAVRQALMARVALRP